MHHFIYPEKDTFITNIIGFENLNFGLDEILRVGTKSTTIKILSPTTLIPISQSVSNLCVSGFSGSIFNSSLYGTSSVTVGTISSSAAIILTSYFTGEVTGSSLTGFSGSISGSFSGSISGSLLTNYVDYFDGFVIGFTGKIITGSIVGVNILQQQNINVTNNIYLNRALVQFDLSTISQSIKNGDIINPKFTLKMNIAREEELPIQYNLYAFPISESWVMGDGYVSDDGSTNGASWDYRDFNGGVTWSMAGATYTPSLAATQSFNYQVGDVSMDVTNIVNSWIYSGSQNNGFLIISSDEFSPTESGVDLYFFSKDTNTIYEPVLDVGWGNDFYWSTGSVLTSSINISTISAGLFGIVVDSASISGSLYGGFTGFGNIAVSSSLVPISGSSGSFTTDYSASGLISIVGVNGLIVSMSIIGNFSGSISSSIATVTKKCQKCHPNFFNIGTDQDNWVIDGQFPSQYPPYPNVPGFIQEGLFYLQGGQNQTQYEGHDIYGWGNPFNEFNQYDWTSDHVYQNEFGSGSIGLFGHNCGPYKVTQSFLIGTLLDGTMPGATFVSSLINGYILGYGNLVGSWNETMIDGTYISASYPFTPLYPNAVFVSFYGNYVNGSAFGGITSLSSSYSVSDYGIFSGVFTSGPLVGIQINAPFSGSILSSSYFYTGSINLISSSLTPVNVQKPFTTVIQNVPPSIKAGDVIRINVFARQEFPLKNFNRQTQFTQFLTPQYLPTSSYYSIKDNETEQIILDFDNYTKISCDPTGNYFLLDTTSYPQERYFRLLIKVEESGSIYTFDKGNIFKIVR